MMPCKYWLQQVHFQMSIIPTNLKVTTRDNGNVTSNLTG